MVDGGGGSQHRVVRSRRARSGIVVLLALTLAVAGLTSCQPIAPIGTKGLGCTQADLHAGNARNIAADDSTQSFWVSGLEPVTQAAVTYARGQLDTTHVDTSQTGTKTSATDVLAYDGNYSLYCGWTWWTNQTGKGLVGLTECKILNAAHECDQHEVRLLASFFTFPAATDHQRQSITLHEFGHTLGLSHAPVAGDVMTNGNLTVNTLSTSDRKAIDGYYD